MTITNGVTMSSNGTNASQPTKDTHECATVSKSRAAAYQKEIKYDRETRDFAYYLDGELMGFARNYSEAEIELNRLVFELLSAQYYREAA